MKTFFSMKKKCTLLAFAILAVANTMEAQQYPLFTNYVTNMYGFNPAVIGTEKGELRAVYRSQWIALEGQPSTTIVNLNTRLGKSPIGVGGYFFQDRAGRLDRVGGNAMISYIQKINPTTNLSIGFAGGMHQLRLQETAIVQNNDPTVTSAQAGTRIPDISMGILLKQDEGLFIGFSVPQLFQKRISFDAAIAGINTTQIVRQYYGMAGYRFKVGEKVALEPSVLMKVTPNVTPQYDFAARAILDKKYWLGASYRSQDAITLMAGIEQRRWVAAYSYDVTTSQLKNTSSGSHEITFGFRFGKPKCKDTDSDGLCDEEDNCPEKAGTKAAHGCPEAPKEGERDIKNDCPDKDNDKICDKDDQCPDVPGPKQFNGCPMVDRDNDGIRDDIDKCPDIPGVLRNEGCPLSDRDRDGVLDEIDPCPDVFGPLTNMGCPQENDRDKDGIPDREDRCPDVAGVAANNGCPMGGDRDGDGIPDTEDKCPNSAGSSENGGCPKASKSDQEALDLAIQNLYFDTDKWAIRPSAMRNLNNVATIMKTKKDWKLLIVGHADPRGNKAHNIELSKNRANSVKNYLISKGVSPNLLVVKYYGDDIPVTKKEDPGSLQMSRRVELEFIFD